MTRKKLMIIKKAVYIPSKKEFAKTVLRDIEYFGNNIDPGAYVTATIRYLQKINDKKEREGLNE